MKRIVLLLLPLLLVAGCVQPEQVLLPNESWYPIPQEAIDQMERFASAAEAQCAPLSPVLTEDGITCEDLSSQQP